MANALIVEPLPFAIIGGGEATPGYSAISIANDYRGVIWRSAPATEVTLIVDLGEEVPIDTIMLFGVAGNFPIATSYIRIALATAAQGAGFSGAQSTDGTGENSYYLDPVYPPILSGAPIALGNGVFLWRRSQADPSPSRVRYLYINFAGFGSGGYVDISRLVIGQALKLERNFSLGGNFGVRDLGSLDFSPRGVLLRRRSRKLRTAGLTFSSIHRDEVEKQTAPLLERIGNTEMVALVTDPDEHPDRQRRSYFGPLVGDLGHVQRRADGFEARINMVSIF